MTSKMNCIQQPLSNWFSSIGRFIGRHPWYFVAFPFLVSIIFGTGFLRIDVRTSTEYLYAPIGSRLLQNKQKIISLFPMNTSEYFDLGRVPDTARFTIVIILAKDGDSVLRSDIMDEVMEIDTAIRELKVEVEGNNLTYRDVCAKKHKECIKNDAEALAEKIHNYEKKKSSFRKTKDKLNLQYPIYINEANFEFIPYGTFLGGVEVDYEGNAESAKAIRLFYFMDDSDKEHLNGAMKWEAAVSNMLESVEGRNVTFTWFSKTSYAIETKKVSKSINLFLIVTLIVMVIFMFVISMSRQWTQSKPWLAIAFIVCVILAIASGLGLGMYCGIKFASVVIFDLFLLIGIGMNDTFTFISSWRKTDRKDTVDNRLAQTYAEIFVPITVTFLIVLISFCIGLTIPFRAAQIFCAYSALTSVFFYLYEMTFLGGCLAISGYRESKDLHPVTCLSVSMKPKKAQSTCYTLCHEDSLKPEVNYFLSAVFRDSSLIIITNAFSRFAIFAIYVAYIVVAALQCTKLQITSGITDIFPRNCHLVSYYERHYKYFTTYPHRVQLVIDAPLDYSNPFVQQQVEDLLQSFENSTYVEKKFTGCWLRIYNKFRASPQARWVLRNLDFIDGLKLSFLKLPMTYDIAKDVLFFNESVTGIDTMRCAIQTYRIHDAETEKDMLDELEWIASQTELPVFFSSMLFPTYDIHRIIREIVLWILPITAGVTLTAFTLLVPSLIGALVATLSTVSIQVGVIGFLALWNVKVNTFFTVMIVMIIGLSVNYVCHMTFAYVTSTEKAPRDRVFSALKCRGPIVIQTTLILIIASAFLMLVGNLLLVIFYKILFLVFVFGALHALFFLPALYFTIDSIRHYSRRFSPNTHELGNVRNSEYIERIGMKDGADV